MTRGRRLSRARPHPVWLVVFLALLVLSASDVRAQDPAAGDTVPADTVVVPIPSDVEPGDTVPTAIAEAAEAEPEVPFVLDYPDTVAGGWAQARWVLTAQEIGRQPGLTLLEIVERLPGMVGFRAGPFGRPEGLAALGLGGGRIRVFVDGLEMAPIGASAFELETIPLLDIERVTVERSPGEVRVDVRTFRLSQPDAHSVVELGTGVYQTRLLRALFSRGFGDRSIGTGTFDLVSARGFGVREPYSHSSAVFRYGYALSPTASVQAEWRRGTIDRQGTLFPRQTTRSDLSLRGRAALRENLILEAALARVSQEEEADSAGPYDAALTRLMVRGAFTSDALAAQASLRLRAADDVAPPYPSVAAEGGLTFNPARLLTLEGRAHIASGAGVSTTAADGTAIFRPIPALAAFATLGVGTRPLPSIDRDPDTPASDLVAADAAGWRAGIELAPSGLSIGVAAFERSATQVAPFGLAFDEGLPLTAVPAIRGAEASFSASLPGTGGALTLDGWYALVPDGLDRPYTPREMGRVGLLFHNQFYGGQLEPSLRIEALHRGQSMVPALDGADAFDSIAPSYQTLHLSLQIRILDLQAFLIWDNLLNDQSAIDFPGDPQAFPRIVYGAEWRFRG